MSAAARRVAYFVLPLAFFLERAAWFASRVREPAVVFVDPDTSIHRDPKDAAYVGVDELAAVLAVKPQPILLCFAYRGMMETVDAFKLWSAVNGIGS